MKRFTETTKWADPWFRKLSPSAKLLWLFLCDNCDQAGVIDLDAEVAQFQIGVELTDTTLAEIGTRITKLECGKLFIPQFIKFQHGELSRECKAHNPIFASIEKYGLERVSKGYPKGMDTLQVQVTGTVKDEVKVPALEVFKAEVLKHGNLPQNFIFDKYWYLHGEKKLDQHWKKYAPRVVTWYRNDLAEGKIKEAKAPPVRITETTEDRLIREARERGDI